MNDHIVSRGWQWNIAEGHELTVLDARTGLIVDTARPIKSNFAELDYMTYTDASGNPVRDVDIAFTKIERRVLNKIREIRVNNCRDEHRDAVADLFGIHLVRSKAMRASKLRLIAQHGPDLAYELSQRPEVQAKFLRVLGRLPYPGEIEQLTRDFTARQVETNEYFVENLPRLQRQIRDMMSKYYLQVVESTGNLPGFIIGDVPVVHAHLATQRFGFKDQLALGDSDYLAGPISRRVAVLFTATRLPHKVVQTKKMISKLNVMAVFAADREVACHPDDAMAVKRLLHDRERFRSFEALSGR
ncbi:MAG: DUF4238 domain-containing protein [Ilumatobacteraceae bacterium]